MNKVGAAVPGPFLVVAVCGAVPGAEPGGLKIRGNHREALKKTDPTAINDPHIASEERS